MPENSGLALQKQNRPGGSAQQGKWMRGSGQKQGGEGGGTQKARKERSRWKQSKVGGNALKGNERTVTAQRWHRRNMGRI